MIETGHRFLLSRKIFVFPNGLVRWLPLLLMTVMATKREKREHMSSYSSISIIIELKKAFYKNKLCVGFVKHSSSL